MVGMHVRSRLKALAKTKKVLERKLEWKKVLERQRKEEVKYQRVKISLVKAKIKALKPLGKKERGSEKEKERRRKIEAKAKAKARLEAWYAKQKEKEKKKAARKAMKK